MNFCSFFGHRNIKETPELCAALRETVVKLIKEQGIEIFLFGSASRFDELCLKVVTEIKRDYPQIRLVYVRSNYPYIEKRYQDYLLQSYDETIFPPKIENAGKAAYVERNQAMIDASAVCVFYYDETYAPPKRKQSKKALSEYQPQSGTRLAYEYAVKKKKQIVNLRK